MLYSITDVFVLESPQQSTKCFHCPRFFVLFVFAAKTKLVKPHVLVVLMVTCKNISQSLIIQPGPSEPVSHESASEPVSHESASEPARHWQRNFYPVSPYRDIRCVFAPNFVLHVPFFILGSKASTLQPNASPISSSKLKSLLMLRHASECFRRSPRLCNKWPFYRTSEYATSTSHVRSPERVDETVVGRWCVRLRHTGVPTAIRQPTVVPLVLALNVDLRYDTETDFWQSPCARLTCL